MADVDILALGEAMIEFNQTGAEGGRLYLQGFGGDSSNFAISAARQGARRLPLRGRRDTYGAMLRSLWQSEGVDDSGVATDGDAFHRDLSVTHDAAGHRFSFFRQGSAAAAGAGTAAAPGDRGRARAPSVGNLARALGVALETGFAAIAMPAVPAFASRSTPTCA
jgi:2-dehydro-3-deoxygluconokinase